MKLISYLILLQIPSVVLNNQCNRAIVHVRLTASTYQTTWCYWQCHKITTNQGIKSSSLLDVHAHDATNISSHMHHNLQFCQHKCQSQTEQFYLQVPPKSHHTRHRALQSGVGYTPPPLGSGSAASRATSQQNSASPSVPRYCEWHRTVTPHSAGWLHCGHQTDLSATSSR